MSLTHLNFLNINWQRKGASPLIFSSILRTSAFSMLLIFSSVYIYELGLENNFNNKLSLSFVVLFFLILVITKLIFLVYGENYSQKKGFKHTIWLSFVPFIFFIPFLVFSEYNFWYLFLAAFFWGAHAGLFWWGYHGYLVKSKDDSNYGSTIGLTVFYHTVAAVVTPIIGAFIIEDFGFWAMYVLAFILMTVSLVVLGFDNEKHQKHNIRFIDVVKNVFSQPKIFIAYIGRAISLDVYTVFWNLYLFLVFGSILELGYIVSASLIISAVLMLFVGRYIDKHGERKTILLASPILSVAWMIRFLFVEIIGIIGGNSLGAFGGRILTLSLDDLTYKDANHNKTAMALLFREFSLVIGSVLTLFVGLILILFFNDFRLILLFASIGSLLPLILLKK